MWFNFNNVTIQCIHDHTHARKHTHTHSNTCTCNLSSAGILSAWYVNTTGLQYLRPSFLACLRTSYSYWTITGSAIAQGYRPLLSHTKRKIAAHLSQSLVHFSNRFLCSSLLYEGACQFSVVSSNLVSSLFQHVLHIITGGLPRATQQYSHTRYI